MSVFDTLQKWQGELPPSTYLSRRAWCEVKYTPKGETEEKDISEELMKYLLSVDYTNNMTDQVDDVSLTLEDRAELWANDWYPAPGAKVKITFFVLGRKSVTDGVETFEVGTYEVDQIELQGMPTTVEVKAVSAEAESTLRGEKKNRTWENITVKAVAEDIAKQNNLTVAWHCQDNPTLDHTEQSDESDLEFLKKVVKDAGFCLKIETQRVIIFDEQEQEKGEPAIIFYHPGTKDQQQQDEQQTGGDKKKEVDSFFSYRITAKTRDVYSSCHVRYKDGKKGAVIEGTFKAPNRDKGKTLEVNEQVKDTAEAERLAKKRLREKNKEELTANFSLYGDFIYAAGMLVELKNFGKASGKYIITKVQHAISGGYTCSIDMRRCLDGY